MKAFASLMDHKTCQLFHLSLRINLFLWWGLRPRPKLLRLWTNFTYGGGTLYIRYMSPLLHKSAVYSHVRGEFIHPKQDVFFPAYGE